MTADELQIAHEAHNSLAAEPRSAAEPRLSAEQQPERIANGLALARRQLEHLIDSVNDKMKMQGQPATLKKEKKKAPDEPRKAPIKSTASASTSAALSLSGATGKKRPTPGSSALFAAPPGAAGKKSRTPASSTASAAPNVRFCLSAAPVAAAPAAPVGATAPAARVAARPAAAVSAVLVATVPAAPASPVAAAPAEAEAGAALPAGLVREVPTFRTKTRRTALGTFRIAEAANKTFIMFQAPDSEKECHVLSVSPRLTPFHNRLGWEVFEKLVAGEIDKAQAKVLRSELAVRYAPAIRPAI